VDGTFFCGVVRHDHDGADYFALRSIIAATALAKDGAISFYTASFLRIQSFTPLSIPAAALAPPPMSSRRQHRVRNVCVCVCVYARARSCFRALVLAHPVLNAARASALAIPSRELDAPQEAIEAIHPDEHHINTDTGVDESSLSTAYGNRGHTPSVPVRVSTCSIHPRSVWL
jgi:hypothetical protein